MRDRRVGDVIYHTSAWRKLRQSYVMSQHGICERCSDVASIVHHKEHITIDNVNDPNVTLNQDNLELLCHDCHNREHKLTSEPMRDGYVFDDEGNFIRIY